MNTCIHYINSGTIHLYVGEKKKLVKKDCGKENSDGLLFVYCTLLTTVGSF